MLGQLQQDEQAALTQPQSEQLQLGAAAISEQQQAAAAQVQGEAQSCMVIGCPHLATIQIVPLAVQRV
jgi:hypothetical protein